MSYQLDHVVHAVSRPEETAAQLEQSGIHTVSGGRHSHGGTYNSLAYFGLSYIEWLGIYDENKAMEPSQNALPRQVMNTIRSGSGFMRTALRTTDLDETAARLRQAGISFTGPVRLGRIRPDGKEIAWTLLFPEAEPGQLLYPFFIEWDEPDDVRLAELKANGSIAEHALGDLHMAEIGFVVRNLPETAARWQVLLNQAPVLTADVPDEGAVKTSFQVSDVLFSLYAPNSTGRIQAILEQRGEHLFFVRMTGATAAVDITAVGGRYQIEADTCALD